MTVFPAPVGATTGTCPAESAQYRLLRQGAHRALSAADLMICATAPQHDLVVLHDDKDFATAARYLPDVRERTIHDAPQPG
ncbi:MAG: PIN domain-containing protein [Streptosporangiaceae bacterium]